MVLRDGLAALSTWTWKETPCEIIVSEIREMGDDGRRTDNFRVYIKYQYTFGERSFVSENVRRKPQSFSDYGRASQLIGRFPAETKAVCYVKSTEPSRAVLLRDNPAFLLTIFFPLIFVVIGAGGIYFVWRPTRIAQEQSQPISERATKRTSQAFGRVFFSVFLLVGLGFLYAFFLRPMFWIISAKQWSAVTCTIISSNLRSHSSSDGTTYSVNIFYTYEFHGQEYKANRYSFMGGSSSGYRGKQHIVEQYPPGKSAVCYVNPNDPTQAVLVPGFTPAMWFGLIP